MKVNNTDVTNADRKTAAQAIRNCGGIINMVISSIKHFLCRLLEGSFKSHVHMFTNCCVAVGRRGLWHCSCLACEKVTGSSTDLVRAYSH